MKEKCYWCNKVIKDGEIALDHFLPRSAGGSDNYKNIVHACKPCNRTKSSHFWVKVGKKVFKFNKRRMAGRYVRIEKDKKDYRIVVSHVYTLDENPLRWYEEDHNRLGSALRSADDARELLTKLVSKKLLIREDATLK